MYAPERGDARAADELLPLVYEELRALARARLRDEESELNIRLAGADDLVALNCMSDAAEFFVGQNRFEEAERLYLRIIAGLPDPAYDVPMRRVGDAGADHAPTHERTVETLEALVDLYEAWGRPAEAAEWRQELPPAETHQ